MNTGYQILALAIALLGLSLFTSGLTGMVVSQSCCFGDECPADYLCDAAEAPTTPPQETITGILLLTAAMGISIFGFVASRRSNV